MEKKTQLMIGGGVVLVAGMIGAYFAWGKCSSKCCSKKSPENIKMVVEEKKEVDEEKPKEE